MFLLYLLAIIRVTLFPVPFDRDLVRTRLALGFERTNNIIPFHSLYETISQAVSEQVILTLIGGNLLMFLPLGVYVPLLFARAGNLKRLTIIGMVMSATIELLQLGISQMIGYNYRSADIDDVILNTTGAMLGYLLLRGIAPWLHRLSDGDLMIHQDGHHEKMAGP